MTEICDKQLLSDYVTRQSEQAFETLVSRYLRLVYTTAFRHVRNPEDANEITQAVFILLAQKAAGLREESILSGWLYQTTRLTSMTFRRTQLRRERREKEAVMDSMQNDNTSEPSWEKMTSYLDDAIARLNDKERTALVLRFFEGRSFPEMSAILGQKQSAIQKRVERSLEKLRGSFLKQGVTISAVALAGALASQTATAAPTTLSTSIVTSTALQSLTGKTAGSVLSQQTGAAFARLKLKSMVTATASLLATVAATIFLLHWSGTSQRQINGNGMFEMRSAGLTHGAPWVFIGTNAVTESLGLRGMNKTDAGLLVPVVWIVGQAYEISPARMSLPFAWPKNDFSFFPVEFSEKQRAVLRQTLQDTYLLTAERRKEPTDVLKLSLKTPSASGLHLSAGGEAGVNMFTKHGFFSGTNVPISTLQGILENYLTQPVIDESGLSNHYDFEVTWDQQPGEPGAKALIQAVREQLGIELASGRSTIETLVVRQIQK